MKKFDKFATLVDRLEDEGFLLFRKELNPYAPETCAEYAFAERSFLLDLSPRRQAGYPGAPTCASAPP